jgi:hypothetical protein
MRKKKLCRLVNLRIENLLNMKKYHHQTDHDVSSPSDHPMTKWRFIIRHFLAALYTTAGPHVSF